MMKAKIVAASLLAILPTAAHAAPRPPVSLERVGAWEINYDEDACHLLARFGEGDAQIIAKFTRFEPGDKLSLHLYGKRLSGFPAVFAASVDFGPVADPHDVWAASGKSGDLSVIILQSLRLDDYQWTSGPPFPAVAPETEAKVAELTIGLPRSQDYRLALRSMAAPMQALRSCLTDLVQHWGYDPAEQAALQRRARPTNNPGSWATYTDYPTHLLARGANGLVQFRLNIDAHGAVSGCTIQQASQPAGFSDLTCQLMKSRARFEPALDKAGKPIASYYVNTVRWTAGSR